jgi:hypothetical protein
MLRDNLVELIEPMRNSAGADPLALGIYQQKPASDDSLSCLENPRPEGAESSLTENVASPFPAEPRHSAIKARMQDSITLRQVGKVYSDGDPDWAKNVANSLHVSRDSSFADLF